MALLKVPIPMEHEAENVALSHYESKNKIEDVDMTM